MSKLDPRSQEIWDRIQENKRRREGCVLHEFEAIEKPFKFKCKNCGCVEDGSFVLAYQQGLEHGKKGSE